MDVVRALALAGLSSDVVAPRGEGSQYSRHARRLCDWDWAAHDPARDAELLDRMAVGGPWPDRPVLYPCCEASLRFASRNRERLGTRYHLLLPDAGLVESLSDKVRFASLAETAGLPVPRTRVATLADLVDPATPYDWSFPVLVKPAVRDAGWRHDAKAVRLDSADDLVALAASVLHSDREVVVQELVDGPESAIESYHVLVKEDGVPTAEFTGRKLRTWPEQFGHSTALTTTDAPDVVEEGRRAVRALGLTGVAKLDFKRSATGGLYLLEVNARFNLWHHIGARIGVNIPALVYTGATEREVPRGDLAMSPSATWVHPRDVLPARASGISRIDWVRALYRADVKAYWSVRDPLPFLAAAARPLTRRLPKHTTSGRR